MKRLIASDMFNTKCASNSGRDYPFMISDSVTMTACQWMKTNSESTENSMKTNTCTALNWTSEFRGLTDRLWSRHALIRGDASYTTLQIHSEIWRYRDDFLQRCACFWKKKISCRDRVHQLGGLRRKDFGHLVRGGLKCRNFNWNSSSRVRFNAHLPEIVKWFL